MLLMVLPYFEVYDPNDFNACEDNFEMRCDIVKGIIKGALRETYVQKSCDKKVLFHLKPEMKVEVKEAFKEGGFMLTPLTTAVVLTKDSKLPNALALGEMFQASDGKPVNGFLKPTLAFPKSKPTISGTTVPKTADVFLNGFWAVLSKQTPDEEKANCKKATRTIVVKVGSATHSVHVPTIINTKALKAGDEVILYSKTDEPEQDEPEEPYPKRHKGDGKGTKGSKGKKRS